MRRAARARSTPCAPRTRRAERTMTDAARAAALAGPPPLRILVLAPQPFFQDRGTPIAARALLETLAARAVAIDLLTFAGGRDVTIARCTIHRIPSIPVTRGI